MSAIVTDLVGQRVKLGASIGIIRAVVLPDSGWPWAVVAMDDGSLRTEGLSGGLTLWPAWRAGPWVNDGTGEARERIYAGLASQFAEGALQVYVREGMTFDVRWTRDADRAGYVVPVGHRIGIDVDGYILVTP